MRLITKALWLGLIIVALVALTDFGDLVTSMFGRMQAVMSDQWGNGKDADGNANPASGDPPP